MAILHIVSILDTCYMDTFHLCPGTRRHCSIEHRVTSRITAVIHLVPRAHMVYGATLPERTLLQSLKWESLGSQKQNGWTRCDLSCASST
jgi:hypothetical protein